MGDAMTLPSVMTWLVGVLVGLGAWGVFGLVPAWPGEVVAALAVLSVGAAGGTQNYRAGDVIDRNLHAFQVVSTSLLGLVVYGATSMGLAAGAMLVGDVLFQGMVNLDVGRRFVDVGEAPTWALGPVEVGKLFWGRGRWVQVLVGLALLVWGGRLTELMGG